MLIGSKGIEFSSLFKSSVNSLYSEPLAFKTSDFTNRSLMIKSILVTFDKETYDKET